MRFERAQWSDQRHRFGGFFSAARTARNLDIGSSSDAARPHGDNSVTERGLLVNSWGSSDISVGGYVREYEQNGADRAKYGESLLDKVAERLGAAGLDELTTRYLRLCRQFAAVYPGIWRSLTAKTQRSNIETAETIWQTLSAKSSTALDMATREPVTPGLTIPVEKLLGALSFTHLEQLIAIEDRLKRAFYEIECIRGNLSQKAPEIP